MSVHELPGGGRALFTTRADGNLSTLRGDGHEQGLQARERLCARLGLRWLCASRQVHGTTVQRVRRQSASGGTPLAIDADGHATTLAGVGAMVLVADCLPVVIGAPGAVAALHAGWRGLADGVLEEGVRALRELGRGSEMTALIGPGAGPCCYEVGGEVHAALGVSLSGGHPAGGGGSAAVGAGGGSPTGSSHVLPAGPAHVLPAGPAHVLPAGAAHVSPAGPVRANIDLPAVARARLAAAGVTRIERVGGCTICDPAYFSHRREGERAGRQAGIAWLVSEGDG